MRLIAAAAVDVNSQVDCSAMPHSTGLVVSLFLSTEG